MSRQVDKDARSVAVILAVVSNPRSFLTTKVAEEVGSIASKERREEGRREANGMRASGKEHVLGRFIRQPFSPN
jgi:hypothetical protein